MGCCDSDSVQVSKMSLEIKSGPMLWHKKRFFGSNWRDVHSVLYNDSSLFWYKDKSRQEQEGGIVLKDAPELIAYGTFTSQVPDRPPLPEHYEPKQFLAFGVRGKDVVYWFLCPNQEEVASWMASIASTMPPPPGAPQEPGPTENNFLEKSHDQTMNNRQTIPHSSQPQLPHQPIPQQPMSAPQYPPQQPPPQYTPHQTQPPAYAPRSSQGVPGQYPPQSGYRPPPYQGYNQLQPQPYLAPAGGATTVVVQQDRPSYIGGGGGFGGGEFAMGMLAGGVLGTAWGARPHFGGGFGFGCGSGWSHGSSFNHHSSNVQDTDITINNYYDNDTTVVNNNLDMTNNVAIEQNQAPQALPLQETTAVEEYVPIEDTVIADYDGGYGGGGYDDGGDYFGGGGDFGGDFGGGDFGGGDFGAF